MDWNPKHLEKEQRVEVFNYKSTESFEKFIQLTEENRDLKHCFDDDTEDVETSSKRWLKILKTSIKSSFNKIRIKKNQLQPELEMLFQKKESLKSKIALKENLEEFVEAMDLGEELNLVNEEIASICANKNQSIVNDYLGDKNDTLEGFTQAKTWSMKKKLAPKNTVDPPAAKKDESGNLVTGRKELENLYLRTYQRRLKPNPVTEEYEEHKMLKDSV